MRHESNSDRPHSKQEDSVPPLNPKAFADGVMQSLFQAPKYSRIILGTMASPILLFFALIGNLILFICTALFFNYEAGVNPQVNTFFDALWWSLSTVTTVGYGDIIPVTQAGRLVGTVAMLLGVAFFVGSTALFVSILIARMDQDIAKTRMLTYREFEDVIEAIKRLEEKIDALEEPKKSLPPS